ncbi:amino acid ABC transporter permease [Martelella sp. HB161492]|uniref:amino acid ABC transporter permease n=1 Tax=Martelella sp. HB161492 TaxID=2720726 RepID=UPI0015908A29|nr:amino acid ABC transporter permease [Martelella sp. HB161492]
MNYNWDWSVLLQPPYAEWLVTGTLMTFAVALSAWVIALLIGTVIGVGRTLPVRPVALLCTVYVEIFRNVPLLVQMFLWYFVVPEIVPHDMGTWMKRDMPYPEFTTAMLALGFYTASRVAEQLRAGIQAVGKGLVSAAYANGLSTLQVYRYILLPIAVRTVIPPMTSEFLTIFKNSSLALTIGVLELTAQSQKIAEYTFHGFEAYAAATVIYVVIALIVTVLMHMFEKMNRIPGLIGKER